MPIFCRFLVDFLFEILNCYNSAVHRHLLQKKADAYGNDEGEAWVEYATVSGDSLMLIPNNLSFAKAAAIPVVGKAALKGIS